MLARNAGKLFVARRMSAIRVPFPGPISTSLNDGGLPMDSHTDTHHTAGKTRVCARARRGWAVAVTREERKTHGEKRKEEDKGDTEAN